ncbi:MAG: hypothetical protein WDN06_13245 [Asticcacaulis sp.]
MDKAGLKVEPNFVAQGLFTYRSGFDAAERILSRKVRPTAIFALERRHGRRRGGDRPPAGFRSAGPPDHRRFRRHRHGVVGVAGN